MLGKSSYRGAYSYLSSARRLGLVAVRVLDVAVEEAEEIKRELVVRDGNPATGLCAGVLAEDVQPLEAAVLEVDFDVFFVGVIRCSECALPVAREALELQLPLAAVELWPEACGGG